MTLFAEKEESSVSLNSLTLTVYQIEEGIEMRERV